MRLQAFLWTLIFGVILVVLVVPGLSHGTLIAVYSLPGKPLPVEEAAKRAAAARLYPVLDAGERFTVKIADSSILTSEFSVPPGVSAYFWSDQTFRHQGFVMQGASAYFESGIAPVGGTPASAPDTGQKTSGIARVAAWTSELRGVSLDSKRLQLRYTVSAPGRVSVEAYALTGRNLGRWTWEETSPGLHNRSLNLDPVPRGAILIRWTQGNGRGVGRLIAVDESSL
jgi:hypothetical protein